MAGIPVLAITTGEPAGIGPEISVAAAAAYAAASADKARLVLIGDGRLLGARARHTGTPAALVPFDPNRTPLRGSLEVWDVPLAKASVAGELDPANAPAVLAMLDAAIDGCLSGTFAAMVTAPVQKSVINDSGIPFSGHTEYLAARTNTPRVVMMLVGGDLRVALATTHLPLSRVAGALSIEGLIDTLTILNRDLVGRFGIHKPRIVVTGLNPHAGESGHLGREEIELIEPALAEARKAGIDARGPYPADTLFQPKYLSAADAVLAMYHDQGLPVLKYASFGAGVNVTLGLPIIRTSVDHGTALDLAGTGQADSGSLLAAINLAIELTQKRGA